MLYCVIIFSPVEETSPNHPTIQQVSPPVQMTRDVHPHEEDGSVRPHEEDGSVRPHQEDGSMRHCQEDSGVRPCQEDSGVRPCQEDSGVRPCQEDSGVRPCQEDSGVRPCQEDIEHAHQEDIQEVRVDFQQVSSQQPSNTFEMHQMATVTAGSDLSSTSDNSLCTNEEDMLLPP